MASFAIIRWYEHMEKYILTINAGSSSIKFALYACDEQLSRALYGRIERIGLSGSLLVLGDSTGNETAHEVTIPDTRVATEILITTLRGRVDFAHIAATGHRIVHGMGRAEHAIVTPELLTELKGISSIDPEHLPLEIAIIEAFEREHSGIIQVACFDTVFHHTMPRVASLIPLPRRLDRAGIRRYGFHGLSYSYLVSELARIDPERAAGRLIILHLGSGASVAAIKGGVSIDTSMGFTPAGGIPMSTRLGDTDPGALLHVMKREGISLDDFNHLINHESGLLGMSETSADMRDLLDIEGEDTRAKEAIDLFCYEAKKRIGSYIAALGGVDTVIFSGGMGEHAPRIRARITDNLSFFGIMVDSDANEQNAEVISPSDARVSVRVMRTNEELMIAQIVRGLISI